MVENNKKNEQQKNEQQIKKEIPSNSKKKFFNSRFRNKEKENFKEKVISIKRISKTVQGGRRMRFSTLVVIGDNKGHYGFAIKKSGEVPDAIKKSVLAARSNVYNIHITKNFSILHDVVGKYCATKVILKPAIIGTGIVAGGPVRAILELAGLKNVVSKVYGARSSINIIRATHNAITQLKDFYKVNNINNFFNEGEK